MTSHDSNEYLESIKDKGFVPATKQAMSQVMENTANIAEMQDQLNKVVEALGKRLEKVEKK